MHGTNTRKMLLWIQIQMNNPFEGALENEQKASGMAWKEAINKQRI